MRTISFFTIAGIFAGAAYLLTHQREMILNQRSRPPVSQPAEEPISDSHARAPEPKSGVPAKTEQPPAQDPGTAETRQPAARIEEQRKPDLPPPPEPPRAVHPPEIPSSAQVRSRPQVTPGQTPKEISRGNPNSPKIAVTFDAGWEFKYTDKILNSLAKHNVRSTFFLTGQWVDKNRQLTQRIANEGHELANHTWTHRRLTDLSEGQIAQEAERTEKLILELTGQSTKPYLRVPYGSRDQRVLRILGNLGYMSIYWDLDSWDSVKTHYTAADIERRVMNNVRNGSIILMHIGSKATADGLDSLLTKLTDAGYRPVTVTELLAD